MINLPGLISQLSPATICASLFTRGWVHKGRVQSKLAPPMTHPLIWLQVEKQMAAVFF